METKKCPYCSEEINVEAIKCKHCGEFLDSKIENDTKERKRKKPSGGVRVVFFGLLFGAIAFGLGYLLFGNILGQKVPLEQLFSPSDDSFTSIVIAPIRNKIIISTSVGVFLGGLIATLIPKNQ